MLDVPLEARAERRQLPALPLKDADRVRVIACGAIAREVIAVCKLNGLDHVDLVCLPAIWHVYPAKIAPAMREAISAAREEGFERIFIGYAECGTQGELDAYLQGRRRRAHWRTALLRLLQRRRSFLKAVSGNEFSAFYLTDLLARQFEAFVIKPMKFDKAPGTDPDGVRQLHQDRLSRPDRRPYLQAKAKWAADIWGWTMNTASPAMAT
jgi:hypothetical protein